jgi:hypothetical protein
VTTGTRRRRRAACVLLAIAAALALPAKGAAAGAGGSYRRMLSPEDRKAYEGSGGRKFLGSLVHVHVPLSVFDREAKRGTAGRPEHLAEFGARGVPILVGRRSEYLAQLRRKQDDRKGGDICVKGEVVSPSWAGGKCFLLAHTLKRAPKKEKD